MSWQLHSFKVREELYAACAQALERAICLALLERGRAQLALAGGSTPLPIYRLLSEASLDWKLLTIVPTDERWVDSSHPACNLRQLKSCFPQHAQMHWLTLVPESGKQGVHAQFANQTLAVWPNAFDAVLLGMGLDAHTASLFPGAPGIAEALDLHAPLDAHAITPVSLPTEAPYPRISLSAARLLRSRVQILPITGTEKYTVFERASVRDDPALPISRLLHAPGAQLKVYWSP